jgi:hypothetical protein
MQQNSRVEQLLKDLCEKHKVPFSLMQEMLMEEQSIRHLKRRRGITERIRMMIEKSLGVTE